MPKYARLLKPNAFPLKFYFFVPTVFLTWYKQFTFGNTTICLQLEGNVYLIYCTLSSARGECLSDLLDSVNGNDICV